MASYCPICELPIKDGDHVRMQVLAVYRQESPVTHGVSVYQEEWIEHSKCNWNGKVTWKE